jgi:hypothetical protein
MEPGNRVTNNKKALPHHAIKYRIYSLLRLRQCGSMGTYLALPLGEEARGRISCFLHERWGKHWPCPYAMLRTYLLIKRLIEFPPSLVISRKKHGECYYYSSEVGSMRYVPMLPLQECRCPSLYFLTHDIFRHIARIPRFHYVHILIVETIL